VTRPGKKDSEPKPRKRFRHLISTNARETVCRCGKAILVGLDDGVAVKAEKKPIDPKDEYQVLVQGHRTYTRQPWTGFKFRDQHEIAAGLYAGETVHTEHHCKPADQ
jgi:hypothetical protein